jgi:hypothetical protein
LHDDSLGPKFFKDLAQNGLEDVFEAFIVVALVQGKVYGVIFASFGANIVDMTCSRKKVFKFMKRACHHSVC